MPLRLKEEREKAQIDEVVKNSRDFQEIEERRQKLRTKIEIENEISGLNFHLKNKTSNKNDKTALRMVRHTLSWAIGESDLTPSEVAEMFLKENS